jgi:hypothetical protein
VVTTNDRLIALRWLLGPLSTTIVVVDHNHGITLKNFCF